MLIGGEKHFFETFYRQKRQLCSFFEDFVCFWRKTPSKILLKRSIQTYFNLHLPKFSWPPYRAFPDTVMKR